MSSEYQIGPDTYVALDFSVFDAEGDAVTSGSDRLEIVFGRGQLLPSLERALDGLSAGDQKAVTLRPRDAYGERDPKAILEVDRSEFPPEVAPGDRFEVENEAGAVLVLQVLDVGPDTVHLDLNHPLAGQEIRIELKVVEVRPASAEELAEADAALEDAQEEVGDSPGAMPVVSPVIPLDRLLRGPARGYEKDPAGDAVPATQSGDSDEH